MNNEDIKSKINDFLVEEFEIDQELINPDAKLKDDLVKFSDPIKIDLMKRIKYSLDPKNIMNPNKLFDL